MTVVKNAFGARYCVYAHYVENDCIYIGVGSLDRAFSNNRSTAWHEMVAGRSVDVVIVARFDDRTDALKLEKDMIVLIKPCCNLQHTGRVFNKRNILCVETGRLFNSVADVATQMKIDQTQIRAVLAGSSKSIYGFSFVELEK